MEDKPDYGGKTSYKTGKGQESLVGGLEKEASAVEGGSESDELRERLFNFDDIDSEILYYSQLCEILQTTGLTTEMKQDAMMEIPVPDCVSEEEARDAIFGMTVRLYPSQYG